MNPLPNPTTLLEAIRVFSDKDVAHDFMVQMRFPYGVGCPRRDCGSASVSFIKTRKKWHCNDCKRQFSVKVGTIFEDSPIGFDKWLPAMWLLSSNRNGISSCELARALGVTQKTAWFMLHRLRLAMKTETFERLEGEVEMDETFIGGSQTNKRHPNLAKGRKPSGPRAGRVVVMGMKQRGGDVRAFVVPDTKKNTLLPAVWENVVPGARVFTDSLGSYTDLRKDYVHGVINHAKEYVRGEVHTNSIENFWSVLKRTLGGTYIAPRPAHLDAYLDEQIFRFNERENADGPRFEKALKGADGRRVTYAQLKEKTVHNALPTTGHTKPS